MTAVSAKKQKVRTSVHKQVRRQGQRQDSRKKVMRASRGNGADVREARGRKRARRLHKACLSRGVPADIEVQSRIRKDRYPHLLEASSERKTSSQNSKAWELQPACMPERGTVTREAHVAECTHEATSARETTRQRDTRIDDHPAMPDDPTDHAVAQTTQLCWRPLASRSGKISHRPDREAGDDL